MDHICDPIIFLSHCHSLATATPDQIPKDILIKVFGKMGGTWNYIDTKYLATPLYNGGLVNHSEYLWLTNDCVLLDDRRNDLLYKVLPRKGEQQKILAKFHLCLLQCQIPQEIPKLLRGYGMTILD